MIGLNAMVASILEATEAFIPAVVPRAYADDISAIAHDQRSDALINNLRRFHSVVRAYEGVIYPTKRPSPLAMRVSKES